MATAIAKIMKALQLNSFDGIPALEVIEKPVPQPKAGEVLIRMRASPVNPSDLVFLEGKYASAKKPPVVPGFEGCGEVVAVGAGLMGRYLLGKRVACVSNTGDGTWAEYMITRNNLCFPLQKNVTDDQGATLFVNPFTAYVLVSLAQKAKAKAIVQTAAAGQVGRMVQRLCQQNGLPVIHVVRRDDQVQLLRGMGAQHVLNSSDDGFKEQLGEMCRRLDASYAFEAVGGQLTSQVFDTLVDGGTVAVYGLLSQEISRVDTPQLIFRDKRLIGFWLSEWFYRQNLVTILRLGSKIQKMLGSTLSTTFQGCYPLDQAIGGIKQYSENMTNGKISIAP